MRLDAAHRGGLLLAAFAVALGETTAPPNAAVYIGFGRRRGR